MLQVGTDASGMTMGLHPRLAGLLNIFNEGRLALVQRTGYPNSSRSHFEASDIWGTANPQMSTGSGWLGRYLDTLPRPLDALAAWNTTGETPRALLSAVAVCRRFRTRAHIRSEARTAAGCAAGAAAAQTMAGNGAGRPHLAYLNGASRGAIETLDRVALAGQYTPTVVYPNNGFALSLRTVAGAIVRGIGSRVLGDHRRLRHACGQGGGGGGAYAN